MFSTEQLVVYPAQGVGKVERIETQEIGGSVAEFYIVRIMGNNITLFVPVKTARNVGLRNLSSKQECKKIFASLKDRSDFTGYTGQNWNRRYREYSERLQTGALKDSCHVLKELLLISGEKELSFGERRLLEQAMSLVSTELAYVLGQDVLEVQKNIEELFADVLKPAVSEETQD